MRLDRIMGVVLSFLCISYLGIMHYYNTNNDTNNSFELSSDKGYLVDNTFNFDDVTFKSNDSNVEIIEYKNTLGYPVELNQNDITITCNGSSKEDEELALQNYKVEAKFAKSKNVKPDNSLLLDEHDKAYIYVITKYEGKLPENEVKCEYNLSIISS